MQFVCQCISTLARYCNSSSVLYQCISFMATLHQKRFVLVWMRYYDWLIGWCEAVSGFISRQIVVWHIKHYQSYNFFIERSVMICHSWLHMYYLWKQLLGNRSFWLKFNMWLYMCIITIKSSLCTRLRHFVPCSDLLEELTSESADNLLYFEKNWTSRFTGIWELYFLEHTKNPDSYTISCRIGAIISKCLEKRVDGKKSIWK